LLFLFFINDIIDDISTDMHVLLVAKDVSQFSEIFHYNVTTCQDKRKNQQFEVPYCHKRNDHYPLCYFYFFY
jgi:hypothetical protein